MIDAQSVKTSTCVPASGQGIDAGKKIVGRQRNIVTDTLGLLPAVPVTAASVQDSAAGTALLDQVAADPPRYLFRGSAMGLPAFGSGMTSPPVTVFVAPQWGYRPSGPA
nr:transposase [Streptomyces sp. 3211]